jgi:hypothetical protein
MDAIAQAAESVARKYAVLRPHLDERQRRLLGAEAHELGRGGIKAVAEATGVHPDTIARGIREVEGQPEPQPRVRAPGGGRKRPSSRCMSPITGHELGLSPLAALPGAAHSANCCAGAWPL